MRHWYSFISSKKQLRNDGCIDKIGYASARSAFFFSFVLIQKKQSAAADKAVISIAKNGYRFAQQNKLAPPLATLKQCFVAAIAGASLYPFS